MTRAIKAAAALRGGNVSTLAAALGVSRPSLSRTVNRSDMTVSDLQRIAAALDCDLIIDFQPRPEDITK